MIENLNLKLSGEYPVTKEELIILVDSWGRSLNLEFVLCRIKESEPKECYPLDNLDVSQITDLSYVFTATLYNGDISKWNVSNVIDMTNTFYKSNFNNDSLKNWDTSSFKFLINTFYKSKFNGDLSHWNTFQVTSMESMFTYSEFNNNSIKDWNVSNVLNMEFLFSKSKFNGDISKWNFNKDVYCNDIFEENEYFENKYNNGKKIPDTTEDFLEWFETNKLKISNLNVSKDELIDIDNYLNNFENNDKGIKYD